MATGSKTLSASWLRTAQARRLGFKSQRSSSVREHSLTSGPPTPAIHGSLASLLAAGFITSSSHEALPLLVAPDGETAFEFDGETESFKQSTVEYDAVSPIDWGCTAPIFANLTPDSDAEHSCGSFSAFQRGRMEFEALMQGDLDDFREMIASDDCVGLVDDESHFNSALSVPIDLQELRTFASFRAVFPSDEQVEEVRHARTTGIAAETKSMNNDSDAEPIGRIVISYRHQEYGANRITYDDWLSACPSLSLVFAANGWSKVRFWSDARLRLLNAQCRLDLPWARIGLEPYALGQVVVFNLASLPSICDRFWLTLERKAGAEYYGTWLTDDTGDLFFYKVFTSDIIYSRAVLTSMSTSQGITWREDRQQIIRDTWDNLEIDSIEEALEMLREPRTYESREDYFDEDLEDVEIAAKGATIQWCGDIEGLIDPPLLKEAFGSVGKYTEDMPVRVVETDKYVKEMHVVVVVLEGKGEERSIFLAKRLFVDASGEIRARSTPRLVESDYVRAILLEQGREIDVRLERPVWMGRTGVDET